MKTYGDGWAAGTQCTQPQGLTPGGRAEVALRPPRRLGGGPRSAPGSRAELRRGWRPQGAGSVTPRPTEARLEHLRAYDNSRRAIRSLFLSLSLSLLPPLSRPPSLPYALARAETRTISDSFSFSLFLLLLLLSLSPSLSCRPCRLPAHRSSLFLNFFSVCPSRFSLCLTLFSIARGGVGPCGVGWGRGEGRGARGRGGKFLGNRGNRGVF